jgi:hypothetical protein
MLPLSAGNRIRATVRMTGFSHNTIAKLLVDMGKACGEYHDANVRGVRSKRVQCDEIWSFVGAKQKNVTMEQMESGMGDV